ncbi:regulatory protein RecX [Halomonas sp. ZH2S]|uniref:Regulatory protein RecX n=1 Tax=Vreelandella zhuhanensis TaxID=2684210 RepID=A0A7X3GYE5_9GAMM|nr:regulatory protein RecX [Halomonas zhuhanensis]MWJ27185.1 regulatory protein RecX [Halomonas zhuhanensis]
MAGAATPREAAIVLLARREHSRAELRLRLARKGHAADEIEACLDTLAEQGLQSDTRFAESFVRSRVMRGQGPIRIRGELFQRGIDKNLARDAIDAVIEQERIDWFALAGQTLSRRFSMPGDTPKERARRERFLASRGFDFEQIRYALDCL